MELPSIHPSPTVLHHTITLSLCLQQGEENGNKLVFIFLLFFKLFFTPLKLPWRTQFYFCCQTKGLNHKDLISSHSVLTTLIFLMFILFEWEMVYVQWEGWFVGRAGLLQKKRKPHKHTKVCCEASGLHSVVRRNNVEPLPFDVREQLLLSDCKMHLIIVYSDTWPLLPSPQSWNTTLSH